MGNDGPLASVIASETSFRRPVTAAIDITTIPLLWRGRGDADGQRDQGTRRSSVQIRDAVDHRAEHPADFGCRAGSRVPEMRTRRIRSIVLCDSSFDERKSMFQSRPCCVIEFDSIQVFQTLSNLDVNYLIPKRVSSSNRMYLNKWRKTTKRWLLSRLLSMWESGSHPMQLLYVPSTSGEGQPSSRRISESVPRKLDVLSALQSPVANRERVQIDQGDFSPKTSSKDYRVRLFYFVFAVLLYNIWRLTDFLLKAGR